jgi:hypothetical protein
LRTNLHKDETQTVEEEWDWFKTGFVEEAKEVCGKKVKGEATRKHPAGQAE